MRRQVLFRLDEEQFWKVKEHCVKKRQSLQQVLENAVAEMLKEPLSPLPQKREPRSR